jgi:hypothetical protein
VEGSCAHGIEPSCSVKCWEVLEGLHNWRILKKGSAMYYVVLLKIVLIKDYRIAGIRYLRSLTI